MSGQWNTYKRLLSQIQHIPEPIRESDEMIFPCAVHRGFFYLFFYVIGYFCHVKHSVRTALRRLLAGKAVFQSPEKKVEQHGDHAQDQDREDDPVELEYLTAVDNHVAESLF